MMSLPAGSDVYTGPWINWSRGLVLGSTITLSQHSGSLLTAFLGIFVTVSGAACWRILSFLIHQHQAKQGLHDAIHHQQQAILRNSSTSGAAAWQMTQLIWHWRKIADKPFWRSLPLITLAICNMLLFAIAGVFSAEVTKAVGNETLIRSPTCGYLLSDSGRSDQSLLQATMGFNAMDANDTLAASAYSRACYGKTQSGSQCYQYPQSNIPWTNRSDVPCPFGSDICKDVGGFEMDTGLIDSHETLGINSRKSDRVQYRKVTTCSILRTKEYSYYFNSTSGTEVQQLVRYYYGTGLDHEDNYTFQYNTNDIIGSSGYTLTSYPFVYNTSKPIPALDRTDADLTLMFFAQNTVAYISPVLDPWFKATIPFNETDFDGNNYTEYQPDFWIGVLACADQFQFRNPVNGKSTPLTSQSFLSDEIGNLQYNKVQMATFLSLYYAVGTQITYYSVHSKGANSLRASDTLSGTDFIQIGLPDNQWMLEATEMFSVSMAKLQQQILNYATGPNYIHQDMTFIKGDKEICGRQKVRGISGYLSFSVLGVSIILILGCLLTFTPLVLDTLVGSIRRRLDWNDHKRLQWAVDEKFQLQRLAFEGAGQGRWIGGTDAVPVTSKDEVFGFGSNPCKNHPRLARDGYDIAHTVGGPSGSATSIAMNKMEKAKAPVVKIEETGRLLAQ